MILRLDEGAQWRQPRCDANLTIILVPLEVQAKLINAVCDMLCLTHVYALPADLQPKVLPSQILSAGCAVT